MIAETQVKSSRKNERIAAILFSIVDDPLLPASKDGNAGYNAQPALIVYEIVGSSLSRSQSPTIEIESVVNMMTKDGASMIHGARVRYSRP
jgi:hypothetical protein